MNSLLGNLRESPDRDAALESYRALANGYDASCRPIERLRLAAIDALELEPGDTVYDVACGTGALLPELARRVGERGRVVGIEQSPDMARQAMARFPSGALPPNVELLVAPVEEASPRTRADALLLCYTHDVLRSPRALENLLAHARPRARIAVLGLQLLPWWWGAPINLWNLWRARRYVTTYRGLKTPWALLAERTEDLRLLRRFHLGTSYLAVGRTR
ncbi:MAG: methyltransferase domain-containing protein [Burkholderiales bacterium]|nr:methyltransferase domain-containing protein [Burkholderiales bacterium]